MFTTYRQQTLFSVEALAKTLVLLEQEQASQENDTSGLKCSASSEKIDHAPSFTKMLEEEFQRGFSTRYVTTWKVRVTKQRRSYSLLMYSVRRTKDTACSSLDYWPTPSYSDNMDREPSKNPVVTSTGSIRHQNANGDQSFMRLSQVVKLWATAQSRDWKGPVGVNRHSKNLPDQVLIWQGETGYLNPDWESLLMGIPPRYTDLTRLQTSSVSQQDRASINILMNRRAQRRRKASTTKNAFRRTGTLWSGSKPRR